MDEMTVLAEARPESWDGSGLTAHAEKVSAFIKNTIGIVDPHPRRRARHAGTLARQGETGLRQAAERIAFCPYLCFCICSSYFSYSVFLGHPRLPFL